MTSIWNNFRKKYILTSLAGFMLLMNAYAQILTTTKPYYDIGFLNSTGHRLDGVGLYYGNTEVAVAGILVKNARATYGSVTMPIPPEAEVQWDENGKHHAAKAKLEGVVPKGFSDNGTIYFVINTNGTVVVKPIKFGETGAVVKLEKAVRPEGEYRIGFVNKTGQDLKEVSVYYGERQVGNCGNLLARAKVGYSDPLTLQIPPEAELHWEQDGQSNTVKVKLEGVIPSDYAEGTIFLVIETNYIVEVKPIKWSDGQGSIKLVK